MFIATGTSRIILILLWTIASSVLVSCYRLPLLPNNTHKRSTVSSSISNSKQEPPKSFGQQIENDLLLSSTATTTRRRALMNGATCTCAFCSALFYTPQVHGDDEIWMLDKAEERLAQEKTMEARFARVMAGGMKDYEGWDQVRKFKTNIFSKVKKGDTVLEIGVGSGPNLDYYGHKAKQVLAVEPNRMFDEYVYSAAVRSNTPLKIVPGRAEEIPVADNSVDVVVGTMVLCSVNDVIESLQEVHRILKPGGLYLFTEHTKAPDDWQLLGLAQTVTEPLQLKLAEGCHLRRNPKPKIEQVFGTANVKASSFVLDNTGKAPPNWPPHFLLAPHYVGYATKV
mmetsp:Transcript_31993/g.48345  ORF Transcript_31993/g.48345 Transcript_31993/m.48345 type:complete len:340 (+) Transcript_31993:55-1074(+)